MNEDLLKQIQQKYEQMGEDPEAYLKGLLESRPNTYWDYIEVETLLSLQRPKTEYNDEEVFIIYHQITELTLKLIINELKQITGDRAPDKALIKQKLRRIIRYTSMLINSFDVMQEGMEYEDFNAFRVALAPASGFQSVQFRYIELYCTPLLNLVSQEGKQYLPENPLVEDYFKNIYWRDAGYDRNTGKTTLTLRLFEEKYLPELIPFAQSMQGKTLADKVGDINGELPDELREALRKFDYFYNVEWPLVHLQTAAHYLDSKEEGEEKAATGGSDWKKYLHPRYQQRKFFPGLWSEEEKRNWGKQLNNL